MSGTDYRALCEELADKMEACWPLTFDPPDCLKRARAALDQPEPEVVGPSDEELLELWKGWNLGWDPQKGTVLMPHPVEYARAVLARWGSCQGILDSSAAPTPAEGEVAELVALIRQIALAWEPDACLLGNMTAGQLARAADLLEQRQAAPVLEPALARINDILNDSGRILQTDELEALELARQALEQRHPAPVLVAPYREIADLVVWLEDHSAECFELDHPEWAKSIAKAAKFLHLYLKAAAVPVPVSERLPGPEDCDAEGRCWWFCLECPGEHSYWILAKEVYCEPTYWLPATALPLPSGEVQP